MIRLVCSSFVLLWSVVVFGQDAHALRRTFLDPSSKIVMVAAHRASHNNHPENSLQAIEESISQGVDIIEIDVKVSADGIPFLMHDRTLDRTTTGKGDPEQYTWEQLQDFNIVHNGKRTALKIPTLEDALKVAHGKILVDLDLKTDRIDKVIEVVNRTNLKEFVVFFDSDYQVLSQIKKTDNEYMIMPRAHSVAEADSAIALFDPPIVHIDFSFYTKECVKLIASSNARVWLNALGRYDDDISRGNAKRPLKKLLAYGANVIQTDHPELLLTALRKKGLHP